jgi:hypothetical protein
MPEKESTLEKVRKLINLASSANQKEAERAAFKACALIRTYGLDVCDPDEIDGIFRKLADAESQVKQLAAKTATDDEDDGYTIFPPRVYTGGGGTVVGGGGGTAWTYVGTSTGPVASSGYSSNTTSAGAPPMGGSAVVNPAQKPMTAPIKISARFDGQCKQCRKRYVVNDEILWQKGVGMWCPSSNCYHLWQAAHVGVPGFNP